MDELDGLFDSDISSPRSSFSDVEISLPHSVLAEKLLATEEAGSTKRRSVDPLPGEAKKTKSSSARATAPRPSDDEESTAEMQEASSYRRSRGSRSDHRNRPDTVL
jgi:hypothetical protein